MLRLLAMLIHTYLFMTKHKHTPTCTGGGRERELRPPSAFTWDHTSVSCQTASTTMLRGRTLTEHKPPQHIRGTRSSAQAVALQDNTNAVNTQNRATSVVKQRGSRTCSARQPSTRKWCTSNDRGAERRGWWKMPLL